MALKERLETQLAQMRAELQERKQEIAELEQIIRGLDKPEPKPVRARRERAPHMPKAVRVQQVLATMNDGPLTIKEIGERMNYNPEGVRELLRELRTKNLVQNGPPDGQTSTYERFQP